MEDVEHTFGMGVMPRRCPLLLMNYRRHLWMVTAVIEIV